MFMNVFPTIFKSHLGPLFTHEETKLFFSYDLLTNEQLSFAAATQYTWAQ